MAVIPTTPGLEVTIIVDDEALPEFDDPDPLPLGQHEVEKYVEAKSGSRFKIRFKTSFGFSFGGKALYYNVHVDDQHMVSLVLQDLPKAGLTWVCEGAENQDGNQTYVLPLFFSELNIVEESRPDKAIETLVKSLMKTGKIVVEIWQSEVTGRSQLQNIAVTKSAIGKIPEKALKGKAISHNISLGQREVAKPREYAVHTRRIGPPIAIFNFKYRSLKSLSDLGIIPRASTPIPLEERPVDELTMEEMRELLRRRPVKPESGPRRHVKRELEDDDHYVFKTGKLACDDDDCSFVEVRPVKRVKAPVELD